MAAVSIFLQPRLILLCFSRSLASAVTLVSCNYAGRGEKEPSADLLKKSLFLGALALGLLHGIFSFFWKIYYSSWAPLPITCPWPWSTAPGSSGGVFHFPYPHSAGGAAGVWKYGFHHENQYLRKSAERSAEFPPHPGLGPVPAYGVFGAAIGTAAGTLFSLLYAWFLLKREGFFHGGRWIPDAAYFKRWVPFSAVY